MKKRIIIAGCVFVAAALLVLPVLAADTHALLIRELGMVTWRPFESWPLVIQHEQVRNFYFLYLAGTGVALIWILVSGNYLNYRSGMQLVTPDIITPRAAGQGQFGTARWLPKEQIGRFFAVWKIPKKDIVFRELMAAGEADRKEVQNAKGIPID